MGPATGPAPPVPLQDLGAHHEPLLPELAAAAVRVLTSGRFIAGAETEAFEREAAAVLSIPHAVGVSSGTDGLLAALMACGVTAGDEVVTTPFSFFASAGAILRLHATPVFADVDPATLNLDPTAARERLGPKTRAVLVVHLFGRAARLDGLDAACAARDIPIVEDAAQAIGAEFGGRRAGALGHMACFSFYPTKNLGGAGDGGMVTTDDPELAEKMRILRDHGMRPKYYYRLVGLNSRLDEVQAAVLRVKLARLEAWHARRAEIAARYAELFAAAGLEGRVALPRVAAGRRHVYNQFVVRVLDGRRDALREHLRERGVGTEVYYPVPLHLQDCFRSLGHKEGDFPESERAARETLALPIFPDLTAAQQEAVVGRIAAYFEHD